MLNFQIVSDLHIEYGDSTPDPLSLITPSSDILILAGDIGSFYKLDQLKNFLTKLCKHFKIVLYIPGNHEYYVHKGVTPEKMSVLFKKFKNIEKCIKNLYILNRSSIQIDDVCIVGCTLWSEPQLDIPKYIVRISDMNTFLYTKKFQTDLKYIKQMIKYTQRKKLKLVVVSHYLPTYSIINNSDNEKKKKDKYISLYASNLDCLLKKELINTWIAGHIHMNFDFITEGGTHLVGNQLGKPNDNILDYNKKMVITL